MRPRALTALTRFGLGPRPGDYDAIKADPVEYVRAQCFRPESALITADLGSTAQIGGTYRDMDETFKVTRKAEAAKGATDADRAEADRARSTRRDFIQASYLGEVEARFDHAVATNDPFIERLVLFWSDHFTIEIASSPVVRVLAGNFEREAIRPYVLGYFSDMLAAATTHPAMLIYLDNWRSVGPNSRIGRRRGTASVNENLARELLELHTLGVNGGYTQEDVIALAETLTGWTGGVSRGAGNSLFDMRRHETGPRTILGKTYQSRGQLQLQEVLPDLATHASTARHIATKMAKYFVSDNAPEALIEELTDTFMVTGGDLREMALVLVESDHGWAGEPSKTVPPYDFMVGAVRATNAEIDDPRRIVNAARALAQLVWGPPSPAGWPSEDDAFLGGDALLERIDFARELARRDAKIGRAQDLAKALMGDALDPFVAEAVDRAEDQQQALVLLLMSPVFHRR